MFNEIYICSRRYFGLARNLIRRIISPNQDDQSYSYRISFPGCRNWVSCQTHSLWLNNAVQCRRPTGRSSIAIAAAAWTHEGTYLIYGFLASIYFRPRNPSWIWMRYIQYATTGTTLCHPQNWLCRCDVLFLSRHLALISPLGRIITRPHASPRNNQKHKLTVTPKFISFNGEHNPSHVQQHTLLSQLSHNSISSFY